MPERKFGYALLDNILGFDDGVNTPGEKLGVGINSLAQGLAQDPLGFVGNAVMGVKGDLDNLMFEGGAMERPEDVLLYAAGAGLPMKAPAGALRSGVGRTAAQTEAQNVLDMLKSGRASEVTDDMMAAADDMYLFDNYDLPMDEASRMARADGMGFDTEAYHGTGANIDAFDPGFSRMDSDGTGIYTSDDPYTASSYAEQSSVGGIPNGKTLPLRLRGDVPQVYADYEGGNWDSFAPEMDTSRFGSTKDPMYDPFGWEDRDLEDMAFERYSTDDIARSAKQDGHEAALFENVTDHVSEHDLGESNVRVDFNPANIRSRFARFDPRLNHLRNLSAGVGGISALPLLGGEQAEIDQITKYLGGL